MTVTPVRDSLRIHSSNRLWRGGSVESLLTELASPAALDLHQPGLKAWGTVMIRKLPSGQYRLYSRKPDPRTGRRRNLGTFNSRGAAEQHERAIQYFKRH